MGVRAGRSRQVVLGGEARRAVVVLRAGALGVEDLDHVQGVHLPQPHQALGAQARTRGVERVRRVDQAALCAYPSHRLLQRQDVRDPLRQEQADDLARVRADLLADDDAGADLA
jgi:hypothetical protein